MAYWGWALLTTRPRLVEWHEVLMVQDTEELRRHRFLTACRFRIEADAVPARDVPGPGSVCSICVETHD